MKLKGFVSCASALMLLSPFASAGNPVQMWKCNINGDINEEAVIAQASEWKKAASALPGGEGMNVWSLYPVAVGADGDGTDVMLVVGWQSFGSYGQWWDAYPSSDVAQMERETMTCHGSALWESEGS
jgi:hypothetical protein